MNVALNSRPQLKEIQKSRKNKVRHDLPSVNDNLLLHSIRHRIGESFMLMDKLDRLFQVVFARCRRKCGDSNIESAWKQAINKVSSYIFWAAAGLGVSVLTVFLFFIRIGSPQEHKRSFMIIALIAAVAVNSWLNRRYGKYKLSPLVLPAEEAHGDKVFVRWFRAMSIGVLVLGCLMAHVLNSAGGDFL